MGNVLFVTADEPGSGKTAVCLGLMYSLGKMVGKVAYFKPIVRGNHGADPDVELLRSLGTELERISVVRMEEVREALAKGKVEGLLNEVEEEFARVAREQDVIVVEGTDLVEAFSVTDVSTVSDINIHLAERLGARVLLVLDGGPEKSPDDIITDAKMSQNYLCDRRHCDLLGVIINKVDRDKYDDVNTRVRRELRKAGLDTFGVVPQAPLLGKPRMDEVAEALGAKVLYGEEHLSNIAMHTIVAAMHVRNMLSYVDEGTLIIVPGDRDDILLAAACALLSKNSPSLAGLVLTGGLYPHENVWKLVEGIPGMRIPVLLVEEDTYTTVSRINEIRPAIRPDDERKLSLIKDLVDRYIDERRLYEAMRIRRTRKVTAQDFLNRIVEQATSDKKHIVFPEGDEPRTLRAVERIVARGVADVTLLGEEERVYERARELGVSLNGVEVIDPGKAELEEFTRTFYELRKHKGLTVEQAKDYVMDPIYYGTMMVYMGRADGLVSGAVHSTAHTIRPALQIIKAKPGISVVSSVFFMCLQDRVVLFGDCAIVPDPTAEQLADIALTSAETALAFGIEPYVAMLSYATGSSAEGGSVEKVRRATELVKERNPDLPVEGPIQFDAAYDREVARIKLPESQIAGKTTVFIFPDLDSGNIAYKAVQRSAGAIAVGPILQGLKKPVNDLSRGCSVEDIFYVTAITVVQAQEVESNTT